MLALIWLLAGCTYDTEYACEPWSGWWSGTLTGDLDATLVGEFHAFFAGAFVPAGGATLAISLRGLDLGPVLGASEPVAPGSAQATDSLDGAACEAGWKGSLALWADLVVVEAVEGTGETGDTGTTGDTGMTGDTDIVDETLALSGTLVGTLTDPESGGDAGGSGTWALSGDGQSLGGDWVLAWDGDFPSAND